MKKSAVIILMLTAVSIFSSTAHADCDDYPLDPDPLWSNWYRWTGQKWTCKKWGIFDCSCEWTGPHHKGLVPRVYTYSPVKGVCTSEFVLEQRADGCSGGPDWDKKRFRAACNEHDKCYASPGASKDECDYSLLVNMNAICSNYFVTCATDARAYYITLVHAKEAQKSYDDGQAWQARNCKD